MTTEKRALTFKWLAGILIVALFGLTGALYANMNEKVECKADRQVVELQLQLVLQELNSIKEKVETINAKMDDL